MERIILHVDMDAFYASVEARQRPELRDVPLVIGADPAGGRGVVCTANYAARRYGIHSAMPIARAARACPDAIFLRPDFPKYKEASREVMDTLARYADTMEVVGMDEAYLDVTTRTSWSRVRHLARSLQAAIRRKTGLTCSIGAAPNKAAAKIASDHRKPHGITPVPPARLHGFMAPLSVRKINGCGPKTAAVLEEWDIHTVEDLRTTAPALLEERLGAHGLWLHHIANGDDRRPVVAERGPAKSRGNERTLLHDEQRAPVILEHAANLLDGLLDGPAAATLTVKIRYQDFSTLTRSHTFTVPLDPADPGTRDRMHATATGLLGPLLDGTPVRLVGVRLSGFQETGQRSLHAWGAVPS